MCGISKNLCVCKCNSATKMISSFITNVNSHCVFDGWNTKSVNDLIEVYYEMRNLLPNAFKWENF